MPLPSKLSKKELRQRVDDAFELADQKAPAYLMTGTCSFLAVELADGIRLHLPSLERRGDLALPLPNSFSKVLLTSVP